MPPAMQNLFAVSASSAPSRTPVASAKQNPSSRFEDVLDDARPKDTVPDDARPKDAVSDAPPKPKPTETPSEAKKSSGGSKSAGTSRTKRQTRRASHGKDVDSAEPSAENADAATTADGPAPDPTDAGPEKKTAEHPAHAKTDDAQQPPIVAAQTAANAPQNAATEQPAATAEGVKKDTNAPQRPTVQALQADAPKKQTTATHDAQSTAGKPADGGGATQPDAGAATQADAAAVAQSATTQPLALGQHVAPRAAKGGAGATAVNDVASAVGANADIDLAIQSSDSLAALTGPDNGEPAPAGAGDAGGADHAAVRAFSDLLASAQGADGVAAKADGQTARTAAAQPLPPAPEARFAEANHAQIVSGVHGQLLPNGGSMQLRLDPPELGALHVTVQMRDGVMTASFETSNDQATRLLTHSLGQLKTALESQGVSVEKLHVEQSPKDPKSSGGEGRQPQDQGSADHPAHQEQQRREMLRRMWRRLSGGQDPLDLVA